VKLVKEKANQKKDGTGKNSSVVHDSNCNATLSLIALDETDRKILQVLQDDFPVVQEPWLEISRRLNISQDEVLSRLKRLIEAGAVLKIGPIFDPSAIGLRAATLVAMRVPKNRVNEVATVINGYPNVVHNYERDNEYNVWFTLAAPTSKELAVTLDEIKKKTGAREHDILDLPTVQRFKVNVRFQLTKKTPLR
jgi:DNA-binding Lrp family transcriptional regulator